MVWLILLISIGAVSVLVLYGVLCFVVAWAVTRSERRPQDDHPTAHELDFEDVEFASRDGRARLSGWYIHGRGSRRTIIFVHGLGVTRSAGLTVDLAARLDERGFDTLLFDLRGHGSSDGDRVSAGYHEKWDVLGAFDFLVCRGVPESRIGVLGASMGAGTALFAMAEEPGMRAVVADSPYADVGELLAREIAHRTRISRRVTPFLVPTSKLMAKLFYGIDVASLVPERTAACLSSPILVIHGMDDLLIPYTHGARVHKAAPAGSEVWLVPNMAHLEAFAAYPEEYVDRVAAYFERRLGSE